MNDQKTSRAELLSTIVAGFSLILVLLMELPLGQTQITEQFQLWQLLLIADTGACAFFWWEFFAGLRKAPDKTVYCQNNFINLLGAIPVITTLRWLRLVRILRLFRFARLGSFVWRFLRIWGHLLSVHPIQSILLASTVLILVGSTGFYYAERNTNPNIRGFFDAVWLTIVSTTTVGYGDVFPVTLAGRIVGVLVMIIGVGILGSLTAAVSAVVIRAPDPAVADLTEIVDRLERIEKKLDEIQND